MGYKQYISRVNRNKIEEIRHLSLEDLRAKFPHLNDDGYIPLYHLLDNELGVRIYELGKYFDEPTLDEMTKEKLFTHSTTKEFYDDHYYPIILNENAFLKLAEHYESNVKRHFNLLLTKAEMFGDYAEAPTVEAPLKDREEIFEDNFIVKRIVENFISNKRLWDMGMVLNKKKDNEVLNNSWLYEYAVFDMLRLHKTADFDKYCYIIYGY